MKTVIYPVYPQNKHDSLLLTLMQEEDMLFPAGKELVATGNGRVWVCTEHMAVLNYAERAGLDCRLISFDAMGDAGVLPVGALEAVRWLAENGDLQGEPYGVLDYLSPGLGADEILAALTQASSLGENLLGVVPPLDHPVQFNAYYNICEVEVHMRPERDVGRWYSKFSREYADAVLMSSPFYFDWAKESCAGTESALQLYRQRVGGPGCRFEPISKLSPEKKYGPEYVWMHYESPKLARRLIGVGELDFKDDGVELFIPFYHGITESDFIVAQDRRTAECGVFVHSPKREGRLIRAYAIRGRDIDTGSCVDQWVNADDWNSMGEITVNGASYRGPVLSIQSLLEDGYVLVLLQPAGREHADVTAPLYVENGPWDLGDNGLARINQDTGREVFGRQDYPEAFELCGSLSVVGSGRVEDLSTMVNGEGTRGFVLQKVSRKVVTELDLLRVKMVRRAGGIRKAQNRF